MVVLTKHCMVRVQQRGIKKAAIEAIFEHGDLVADAKSGCLKLGISKKKIGRLTKEGAIDPKVSDKLPGRWIIIDSDDNEGVVVTAYANPANFNKKRRKNPKVAVGKHQRRFYQQVTG